MDTHMCKVGIAAVALVLVGAGCGNAAESPAPAPQEADNAAMEEQMEESTTLAGGAYMIDAEDSTVEWFGKKRVGGAHDGTVMIKSGKVMVGENQEITSGSFVIDMTTIDTYENLPRLEDHLNNEDFFDTATHPEASFEITSAIMDAEGEYTLTGNLTIKGITNEISFPASIVMDGDEARATAQFEVDRALFDIRYGSESFFGDLGDAVIEDNMRFTLEIVSEMEEADAMMEAGDMDEEDEE